MRDDFSAKIIGELGKRVAYRCSRPDCRNQTIGPQETDPGSVSVGVAAHIHAASAGGKRYKASQTPEERSSQENGIWLCQTCAKLIDSDESRFSPEALIVWKIVAEKIAMEEIGKPAGSTNNNAQEDQRRPRLDIAESISFSGGADGFFINFEIKNEGDQVAMNIQCSLVADDTTEEIVTVPHKLSVAEKSRTIQHPCAGSKFFLRELSNPRLLLRYASPNGTRFQSSRTIMQTKRADTRYSIKEDGHYSDRTESVLIELETRKISFSMHSRLQEGLADSFSITAPVIIRNLSKEVVALRNVKSDITFPEGYRSYPIGEGFKQQENIASRGFITKNILIGGMLIGREKEYEAREIFEASKNKALASLALTKVILKIKSEYISLAGVESLENNFDLTSILMPEIKK